MSSIRRLNITSSPNGYSVIELAVVVAILSVLAGITLPNIIGLIKSSRIDSAKTILNSSIAYCLGQSRSVGDLSTIQAFSAEATGRLAELGYKLSDSKQSCLNALIEPIDANEDYMFAMGFNLNQGVVQKVAFPAANRSSEGSCKLWGICGIPPELQEEWDRLAKIESDKKACNDAFYTFLSSGSKGQKNVWDDTSQSCSRAQWVLDGTRYTSKDAYDATFTAKVGKECLAELSRYASSNPPNGRYTNQNCDIDTYFLNGVNLETSDPVIYQAKSLEYTQQQCAASEASWISSGSNGAFRPPSGIDCQAKWKCGTQIYTDEASYKSSSCGAPPPPPPAPAPVCRIMTRRGCILWG